MAYNGCVELWWAEEDADYIRNRSTRYRGALDLEPGWTQEVMVDEHLVELSPYRRRGSVRPGSLATPRRQVGCSW